MSISRKLVHIDTPQGQPGFLGRGHVARPVIQRSFAESDPFIMLMDDMLDKKMTLLRVVRIRMRALKRCPY
jgi:hypothetical protein